MATTEDRLRQEFEELRNELRQQRGLSPAAPTPSEDELANEFQSMSSARGAAQLTDDTLARTMGQGGLGPTLDEPMTRTIMGMADTFMEKRAAFKQFHPEGELFIVRGEPQKEAIGQIPKAVTDLSDEPPREILRTVTPETILYRRSPAEPWGRINDENAVEVADFTEFFADDFGTLMGELILFKGIGGIAMKMLQAAAGAAGGDIAQQSVEAALGLNEEPWDEIAERTFVKSAASAVGAAAASPFIVGGERAFRGRGVGVTPESEAAIAAATEIGLEEVAPLTSAQISANPIINRLESLSEQVSGAVTERKAAQQRFITGQFEEKVAEGEAQAFMTRMTQAHEDMKDTYVAEMQRLSRPGVDFEVSGEQLSAAYNQYAKSSKRAVDAAYSEARSQSEPVFNMRVPLDDSGVTLRDVVSEQLVQLRRVLPRETEEGVSAAVTDPLKDQSTARGVVRIFGNILNMPDRLQPITVSARDVMQGGGPALERLSPAGRDFVVQPVEYLRGLRSDLFDLAQPTQEGVLTTANRAASIVKAQIDRLLDSPVAGNTEAFRSANRIARERYETLEDSIVSRLAKSDRPAEIAQAVVQPGRAGNRKSLEMLRSISTPEQYRSVQNAWLNTVIDRGRRGENIGKILDEFDDGTRGLLLSQSDQRSLRQLGEGMNRLNTGAVQKALEQQTRYLAAIDQMVAQGSTREIDNWARTIRSADEGTKRSAKAALWDWAARDMIVTGAKGVKQITPTSTQATIDKIERTGLKQFFTSVDDIAMLRALPTLAPFIKSTTDAGSALAGAQVVAGVRGALNPFTTDPGQLAMAVGHLVEMIGLGRMMINPKFRRFVVGHSSRGFKPTTKNAMRFAGAYAATTASEMTQEGNNLEN